MCEVWERWASTDDCIPSKNGLMGRESVIEKESVKQGLEFPRDKYYSTD